MQTAATTGETVLAGPSADIPFPCPEGTWGANRHLLCQAGFDGVLIRALEEAVWLKDLMEQENQKTSLPFGMDASVYGWNSRSARCSMGTSLLTMPWELNSREIEPVLGACRGLGMASELIIYETRP